MLIPLAKRRMLLRAAVSAPLLCFGTSGLVKAGKWPEKPIRLVIGYPTGGAADGVARRLQSKLEAQIGQPLIFDYRPGAGATIAADYVAHAPPDGYTLHFVESSALTIQPNAHKVNYDPLSSFTLIGLVATGSAVLVAHPSVPANNVPQLIAMLKAKPWGYAFGSPGIANFGHMAGELFQSISNTEMVHAPYKGGAQAIYDLVGGQVPLLFASMGSAMPYIQSGKIKALGVTSATRVATFPDIPTIAEQGLPGYEMTMWFALIGPAKLSVEKVTLLGAILENTLADAAVQSAIRRQGYEPTPSTSQQLHDRIQADLAKWRKVISDRKLNLE